jgi:hypothetical protein
MNIEYWILNIYDSDNLSLQTQPKQLTSRLRLEPRTCQVQSSSKDLILTTRAHHYLFLYMLVFVSLSFYEQHRHAHQQYPSWICFSPNILLPFFMSSLNFAPDITSIQVTTSSLYQVHQMTVHYGSCSSHNELSVKFLYHAPSECSSGLEQHTASIFKVAEVNTEGIQGEKIHQSYGMVSWN